MRRLPPAFAKHKISAADIGKDTVNFGRGIKVKVHRISKADVGKIISFNLRREKF